MASSAIGYRLAAAVLALARFEVVGKAPESSVVVVAAPHTSIADFPLSLSAARVLGLRLRWLGKASIFRPPFGWLLRRMGGVAVDRSKPDGLVEALSKMLASDAPVHLMMAVEGTTRPSSHWKSGFYRIARQADVPVALAVIDGQKRQVGIVDIVELTGDVRSDMDRIRDIYSDYQGIHPHKVSPVRLRDEARDAGA